MRMRERMIGTSPPVRQGSEKEKAETTRVVPAFPDSSGRRALSACYDFLNVVFYETSVPLSQETLIVLNALFKL
jgi:hypothetical protein